jgi:predicted transcriptional regulator
MFRLRVQEVLAERGLNIGKVSRGADIPLSTVRRMVKQPNIQPRLDALAKLAKYLQVPMETLIEEVPDEGQS